MSSAVGVVVCRLLMVVLARLTMRVGRWL